MLNQKINTVFKGVVYCLFSPHFAYPMSKLKMKILHYCKIKQINH